MKNLNVALVRLLQFVVFMLFTFIVLVYFGTMILLPLDIVVLISKLLGGSLIGVLIAVPVVAYLGKIVYTTPGLIQMIIDGGIDLVHTGKQRVEAFNKFAETAK
ncbi:MAG: hypothetical protein ACU836_17515 [Gammaproteobacteria bacterium]